MAQSNQNEPRSDHRPTLEEVFKVAPIRSD
jgi:hypothetical protein